MSRSTDKLTNGPCTANRRARVVSCPQLLVPATGAGASEQQLVRCEVNMKRSNRSWGNTAIAWLIVASLVAPTAASAWTPGEGQIDRGDEPGPPQLDAVGDPDDGTSGAPRRASDDLAETASALLVHYLRVHVDARFVDLVWFSHRAKLPFREARVR